MSAVVLFDGVCNLCNGAVDFIVRRDPAGYFQFAPLQSETARRLLAADGKSAQGEEPDSILLIEEGHVFDRSTAVLRIGRRLRGLRALSALALLVPRFVRDSVYRLVARRRYRWFGRRDTCRVPSPELAQRFLD